MAPWPYAGPRLAWWPRRKTSASSQATNCSGCSKLTWTNPATDNWSRRGMSDRVFNQELLATFNCERDIILVLGLKRQSRVGEGPTAADCFDWRLIHDGEIAADCR